MNEKTQELADLIVAAVEAKQGCKGTELACLSIHGTMYGIKFTEYYRSPQENEPVEFYDILDMLVEQGRLVELEYTLPDMPWRLKSFYLPAGTKIRSYGEKLNEEQLAEKFAKENSHLFPDQD